MRLISVMHLNLVEMTSNYIIYSTYGESLINISLFRVFMARMKVLTLSTVELVRLSLVGR